MLTTNVTRQDRLFLRLTGPKMVNTCETSISKRVFTSIWLTHISFSHLSFKITGKQAWFGFLCYQTRHQNFRWKHGYFIEFPILRRFVHCTFTVAMYEYHWKSFMFKIPQILVIMGAVAKSYFVQPSTDWLVKGSPGEMTL